MKNFRTSYLLWALAAVLLLGFYTIDFGLGQSDQASMFTMPDFASTTEVPESNQQTAPTLKDFNDAIVDIADQTTPTVVTIRVTQTVQAPESPFFRFFGNPQGSEPQERQRRGLGSGVIVSQDGYILTNNHVIEDADDIMVGLSNGETYDGEIVGRDPQTDIAVIKIDGPNFDAIKIGDSDDVRVGEMVLAIGSPLKENLAHSVSMGIVSAKDRSIGIIDRGAGYENFLQTDAAINPGNSGGALVNMDGELVGINSAIASRSGGNDGIGFAVPSNLARDIMESLIENGRVVRAYLGIIGRNIDRTMARAMDLDSNRGILINNVYEDTPAERAGLKEGDIIRTLNGKRVDSYDNFRTSIAFSNPGDEVTLGIIRDGDEQEITVTLGELDSDQIASTQDSNDQNMQKNLGFNVDELTSNIAQQLDLEPGQGGVVVTNVTRGSNAHQEGLRRGDVITKVGKQSIENVADFREEISKLADEDNPVVLLQVITQGVNRYIAFEL